MDLALEGEMDKILQQLLLFLGGEVPWTFFFFTN